MKKVNIAVGVVVVIVVLAFSFLSSRRQPTPNYDPARQVRVQGSVQELQEFYCPVTEDRGAHFILKTDGGPVLVHVGVARVLRGKQVAFAAGDRLEVIGWKFPFQGKDSLIAREISRGNETFIFRDESGKPRLTE